MRSPAQIEAARLNGAKSRGPVTPEGRHKSSLNALQHGLFAQALVLTNESREDFEQLQATYLAKFQPADNVEAGLVNEMVAAKWRQNRAWNLETATLDLEMLRQREAVDQQFDHIDEPTRLALAHESVCNYSKTLAQIARAEAACNRQFDRALKNLLKLRASGLVSQQVAVQNEPETATPVQPEPGVTPVQNEPKTGFASPAGTTTLPIELQRQLHLSRGIGLAGNQAE